ncbi:MAG: hypothetical protein LBC61_04225 [Candidatus Peribacteria bacterium]|jgi:hypothetical protein|nr:hypothetical protein [Candidatus Peribacteria bacterium]
MVSSRVSELLLLSGIVTSIGSVSVSVSSHVPPHHQEHSDGSEYVNVHKSYSLPDNLS